MPRVAQSPFVGSSELGVRGDVIHQMDWQVGEILKALDRLGLAEDTLVIFTSDNGPVLFDGYRDRSQEDVKDHRPAGGLRGWKYLVYEGGCRVPLIARWPARIKPRVTDQMSGLVDVFATVAKIAGSELTAASSPDRIDLYPVLLGQTAENLRDHTVLHVVSDALALRAGDWKFIPATGGPNAAGGGGANFADPHFVDSRSGSDQLFNLRTDPAERLNVIKEFPAKAEELRQKLQGIRARN